MAKKPKATENKVEDVEAKSRRKNLAAELGELVIEREKVAKHLNAMSQRCNQLATAIESLKLKDKPKRDNDGKK